MKVPSIIDAALTRYNENFRHPSRRKLQISDIYALFPDEVSAIKSTFKWPQPWSNADSAGIYLIFGSEMQLLFVGRANNLNARISQYFRYHPDGSRRCEIRHTGWSPCPSFVVTIAVDEDMPFKASALEEYLIAQLQPPDNTRGIIK